MSTVHRCRARAAGLLLAAVGGCGWMANAGAAAPGAGTPASAPPRPTASPPAAVQAPPVVEPRQRLDIRAAGHSHDLALTLDACGGGVDQPLLAKLVQLRIPATLFVTRRWLDRHPQAVAELRAHPELFEFENHGAEHIPAVLGRRLYGMSGPAETAGIEREIADGAAAVERAGGRRPRWFRGAGAAYDTAGLAAIARQGYQVAGFSLNGDDGATAPAAVVAARLRRAQPGDIVLAHMNKPASGTAEGLAAALPELQARGMRFVRLSEAAGVVPADRADRPPLRTERLNPPGPTR